MFKKLKSKKKKADAPPEPDPLMIPSYFGGFGPPARFRQRKKPEDALSYDYRLARHNLTNPNSIMASVVHMLMYSLGSGSVAAHAGFMSCGIWASLGVTLVISCGVGYCACILVWSAQKLYGRVQHPQLSYQELAEATLLLSKWPWMRKCARPFRYVVEFTLAMHCYTSCCVFVIMIGRNLKELVEGDEKLSDAGDPPLKVYILSMMVPCVIVCMVTNLKYLAPFALIAVIYSFAVLFITVWYAFQNAKVMPWERPAYKSILGLAEMIGMCIFVTEISSLALPIENHMDTPKKFHYVVLEATPIVALVIMVIGFCGYWNYGELSFSPILLHFPFSPFPIQLKVFLCLLLYVVFAMKFYSGFDIEWFYLKRHHQQANYWFWERLYRSLHVVVIDLVAYSAPNVSRDMAVVGCIFTSPIVFIYPTFIYLIVNWEHPGLGRYKWRLVKCSFMLFFAFMLMLSGTGLNIFGFVRDLKYTRDVILQSNSTDIDTDFFDIHGFNGDY